MPSDNHEPINPEIVHDGRSSDADVRSAKRSVDQRLYEFEAHLGRLTDRIEGLVKYSAALPLLRTSFKALKVGKKAYKPVLIASLVAGSAWFLYKQWQKKKPN